MSRGNLAEDPRVDRPSSSRYTHLGAEAENKLLYAPDVTRKKGTQGSGKGTVRSNQKSAKKSVGRSLPNSQMSRLEVGGDGRLFGVHVKEPDSVPKTEEKVVSEGAAPAAADAAKAAQINPPVTKTEEFPARSVKPGRPYLETDGNPLLSRDTLVRVQDRKRIQEKEERELKRAQAREERELKRTQEKEERELKRAQAREERELKRTQEKEERELKRAKAQEERELKRAQAREEREPVQTAADTAATVKETAAAERQEEKAAKESPAAERQEEKAVQENQTAERQEKKAVQEGQAVERHERRTAQENPLLQVKRRNRSEMAAQSAAAGMPAAGTAAVPVLQNNRSAGELLKDFALRHRKPLLVSLAAVLTAGYISTAVYYHDKFYPGTKFFGIPAAGMTVEEVKTAVTAKVNSYSLSILERNGGTESETSGAGESAVLSAGNSAEESRGGQLLKTARYYGYTASGALLDGLGDLPAHQEQTQAVSARQKGQIRTAVGDVIEAEQIRLRYQDNGEIEDAMEGQMTAFWPVMMIARGIKGQSEVLKTQYDRNAAEQVISGLSCFDEANIIAPVDAQLAFNQDGAYVSEEIMGNTLDTEAAAAAVKDAFDKGITQLDFQQLGFYKDPVVYSDDAALNKEARRLNKVLGACVTLDFGDRSEQLDPERVAKFLSKGKNGRYFLDEEKVRRYVSSLAEKFDTVAGRRTFYTSLGTEVELYDGNYGWILDQEATYEELLNALKNRKKGTLDPVYTQTAKSRGLNDIGDTYIEINITNQRMWMYKEGKLIVDTPVVTGNPYKNNDTPSGGVWRVYDIQRNVTLRGVDYRTPVDYWIGFNGGVGVHDLQSRYYFGGQIYQGSGSHGCVNTPLAAVKLIYQAVEYGTPVIVYQDESQEALDAQTGIQDIYSITQQVEYEFGTVEDDGLGSIVNKTAARATGYSSVSSS